MDQTLALDAEHIEDQVGDANVGVSGEHPFADQREVGFAVGVECDELAVERPEHGERGELGEQRCHLEIREVLRPFPGAPLLPHDALQSVDADGPPTMPQLC